MRGDFAVAVVVHLRDKIGEGQLRQHFSIVEHDLPGDFFSDFQAQRVVVIQVPVSIGEVQPRLQPLDVHPCVGHGSHCSADFTCRDVTAFDEQFLHHVRLRSVADVKHREFGEAVGSPRTVVLVPTHRINDGVAAGNAPRVEVGDHHQPVAVEHHRHR